MIRDAVHAYSDRLTVIFKKCIKSGKFPDILKFAHVTPVFEKGDPTDKSNYRSMSTLKFFKLFEKLI